MAYNGVIHIFNLKTTEIWYPVNKDTITKKAAIAAFFVILLGQIRVSALYSSPR